jgi:hypothetical protein
MTVRRERQLAEVCWMMASCVLRDGRFAASSESDS